MGFTIDQLRAFTATAETGSFSAAARRLGKAQSAVSTAVMNLELEWGVELFRRDGRLPELTEPGRAMLADARRLLAYCGEMETRALGMAQGAEARLSLVLDDIVATESIYSILKDFERDFPHVELEILMAVMEDVGNAVVTGRADIGMTATLEGQPAGLEHRHVIDIDMIAVASAGHPLTSLKSVSIKDLREYREILITSRGRRPAEGITPLGRGVWRAESDYLITDLVRHGLGWAFVPAHIAGEDIAAGLVKPLPLDFTPAGKKLPIYLFSKAGRIFGSAGSRLLEELGRLTPGPGGGRRR